MILLDDNFAGIVSAVEEGRAVFGNLREFICYVLTSNVTEVVPYLAFAFLGIPLPLSIIQILLVDLGTDMLPALGLGADPPDPGGMQKAPRPRHEKLLNGALMLRAYIFLPAASYACREIADVVRVDADTVTEYARSTATVACSAVAEDYRRPTAAGRHAER